jgi:hypothetical protein
VRLSLRASIAGSGTEFMVKKKIPARVPWTKEDVGTLKVHSKSRTPAAEVVNALKRTEAAVRQKAKSASASVIGAERCLTLILGRRKTRMAG